MSQSSNEPSREKNRWKGQPLSTWELWKSRKIVFVVDMLFVLAGTALYALGVHVFTAPNQIAPGGVTGLATAFEYLTGFPIGITVALVNIPLLLIGFRFVGKSFFLKTMVSTAFFTFSYEVLFRAIPVYHGQPILAALFGGVLIGAGLALVFMRGGSTGGTDILSKMIHRRFPHLQLGRIVFLIDLVIIALAALAFRNFESAMYAVIAMFTSAQVMDSLLYGMDQCKMAMVVTDRPEDVSRVIGEGIRRGTTLFEGKGGFTGSSKTMVLCAVRKSEFYKLKRLVHGIDPQAFMIAANANEVLGEGFKPLLEKKQ